MQCKCLIDTGASISCISQNVLTKIRPVIPTPYASASHTHVLGVGGKAHKVLGSVNLGVCVQGKNIEQSFYILDHIPSQVILGMDFLQSSHAQIDLAKQCVTFNINDQQCTSSFTNFSVQTVLLKTTDSVYLEPHSETVIPVRPSKTLHHLCTLVEGTVKLNNKYQVAVARAVVAADKHKTLPCRILNPHSYTVELPAGLAVAKACNIDPAEVAIDQKQEATLSVEEIRPASQVINQNQVTRSPKQTCTESADRDSQDTKRYMKIAMEMGTDLTKADLTEEQKLELLALLGKYRQAFAIDLSELGKVKGYQHVIDTGGVMPKSKRFYRQSPKVKKELEKITEDLLKHKLITPSNSPVQSPVIMVRKANGQYRMAIDLREVNRVTKPVAFPLPRFEDLVDSLSTANPTLFTAIDLYKGYNQITLDPATRHLASFVTHTGQYCPTRMVEGLSGAPITFLMALNSIFRHMAWKHALIYLDDILLHSPDWSHHKALIEDFLQTVIKAGLRINPAKCNWCTTEVKFLGHKLSKNGISVQKDKVTLIENFKTPQNIKQLRSFLGLASYYRKFIKSFATIASPLYALLQHKPDTGKPVFEWTDKCQQAFHTLKKALTTAPVLSYPNMDKEFILTTDSSRTGLGYILGQLNDKNQETVIAFGGRALRPSEKNYPISELECLAVVEGIKQFDPYLSHKHFKVVTDHQALKFIKSIKNPTGRLARWSILLQGYSFTVVYKPGKSNTNADAISRMEHDTIPEDDPEAEDALWNKAGLFAIDTIEPPRTCKLESTKVKQVRLTFDYDNDGTDSLSSKGCAMPPVNATSPVRTNYQPEDKEVYKEQQNCPEVGPMYAYVKSGIVPTDKQVAKKVLSRADEYGMRNKVLYHVYQPRTKGIPAEDAFIHQLVIPKSMRAELLYQYHSSPGSGGHFGFERTYSSLRLKYFWQGMYSDTYDYVSGCPDCQKAKRDTHHSPVPLHPLPMAPEPRIFQRWHMDFFGPIKSKSKYKYLLMMTDSFSHFPEIIPMEDTSAEHVAFVLYKEIFSRYGAPRELITDRAQNFRSKMISALSKIYKVKRHFTSAYKPSSNAAVERLNATIAASIRACINKPDDNWEHYLYGILAAFRATPIKGMHVSPYFLAFGRHMSRPADASLMPDHLPQSVQQHLQAILRSLEYGTKIAEENHLKNQATYKEYHDRRSKDTTFRVGDHVLIRNYKVPQNVSAKLVDKYTGPLYVTEAMYDKDVYRLRYCTTNKPYPSLVHADRMKLYKDPLYQIQQQNNDNEPEVAEPTQTQTQPDASDDTVVDEQQLQLSDTVTQPSSQPDNTAPHYGQVEKLLSTACYKHRRLYKVKFVNEKQTQWIAEEDIPASLKEEYHINRTLKGRARKRKRTKMPQGYKRP